MGSRPTDGSARQSADGKQRESHSGTSRLCQCFDLPASELGGFDAVNTCAEVDLYSDEKRVADSILFFARPRELRLPAARLHYTMTAGKGDYLVGISTDAVARDVALSFGSLDAQPSDNFFDLMPGEVMTVHISTNASLEQLRAAIHVMALVDAESVS